MARWITCAVNGSAVSRADTPHVAITPAEIAADACAAARAGAAVVHCHVRDPETGRASNAPALYAELVARIREADADVLIHLSSGGGGTLPVALTAPAVTSEAAALILPPEERIAHLSIPGVDLTGLDCGSFSYGHGGDVYLSPTDMLFRIAALLRPTQVLPELTVFDLGQMALASEMRRQGAVTARSPFCLGFGVVWGAPPTPRALDAMLDGLPQGADWGASSKGDAAHRALAPLVVERGGGLRTGIEDHHLFEGEPVPNARLVEEAARVMASQGVAPLTARALRTRLGL